MKNYTAFLLLSVTFTTYTTSEPTIIFKASERRLILIEDFVQLQTTYLIPQYHRLTAQSRQAILSGAKSAIIANCPCYNSTTINEHCAQQEILKTVLQETLNMYRGYCHSLGLSDQQTECVVYRMDEKMSQALSRYGFNPPQGFFSNYLDNMHYEVQRVQEETNSKAQVNRKKAQDEAFAVGVAIGGLFGWLFGSTQNPAPSSTPAPVTPSAPPYHAVTKKCNNCKNDVLPTQNNACPTCGLPFY